MKRITSWRKDDTRDSYKSTEEVVLESGNRRSRRYLSSRKRRPESSAQPSFRWREVFTVVVIGLLSAAVTVAAVYIRRGGK